MRRTQALPETTIWTASGQRSRDVKQLRAVHAGHAGHQDVEMTMLVRADGVSIEIDDSGTGYSSLSPLKHLSIDTIKSDRSFIVHLDTDRTLAAL